MDQNTKFIKQSETKISFNTLIKKYFQAREDVARKHDDEEALNYDKKTMELYRHKIEHELFEMWKDGKITITFEQEEVK